MRYISEAQNLVLYNQNGKIAYRFKNHELVVGLTTTASGAGNSIDSTLKPSDTDNQLQRIFSTDLLGATTACAEMCGQGSLTSVAVGGNLTKLENGYKGIYFEAPVKSGGDTVSPVAGITYKVLSGTITYNSVAYTAPETFVTTGGVTATSGSGAKFALGLPPIKNKSVEEQFLTENFKEKHLLKGNESPDYFNYNIGGAAPYDSMTSSDTDFFGYIG